MKVTARALRTYMKLWPPYLGAGVRLREFADDGSRVVVTHHPRRYTKNGIGTAFGGTILSMTDPFYVLASMVRLGEDYIVWDTRAEVDFLKPGRSSITAVMTIDDDTYELIKERTADGSKYLHWFETDVTDKEGEIIAKVRRQVYYRRRRK